jgi:hypothetical protein
VQKRWGGYVGHLHPGVYPFVPEGAQRELHLHKAPFAFAASHWRVGTNNHEPLHSASLPEFLLRRLVGRLIETRIAYPRKMLLVWLPLDRVARELFLLVFEREENLEVF